MRILALVLIFLLTVGTVVRPSRTKQEFKFNAAYSSNNLTFLGKALQPCEDSEACWQIQSLTYSGSDVTDADWCNGDPAYAHVWDDRATAC